MTRSSADCTRCQLDCVNLTARVVGRACAHVRLTAAQLTAPRARQPDSAKCVSTCYPGRRLLSLGARSRRVCAQRASAMSEGAPGEARRPARGAAAAAAQAAAALAAAGHACDTSHVTVARPPGQTRPLYTSTRRTLHLNPSGPPPRRRAQRANSNAPLPPFLFPHAARTQARAAARAHRARRARLKRFKPPSSESFQTFSPRCAPSHTRARLSACARAAACARDGSAPRAASFESSAAAFSVNTDGELEAWRARLSSALARRGRCRHCLPPRRGPARRQQACASSTHACCTGRHTGRHVGTPASVRDGNSLISGRFAQSGPAQLHVLPSFPRRRAAASGAG